MGARQVTIQMIDDNEKTNALWSYLRQNPIDFRPGASQYIFTKICEDGSRPRNAGRSTAQKRAA